jgi:arsenic resistance protein ArsH
MGDLNNTSAAREHLRPVVDPEYRFRSFAIPAPDDDPVVRQKYRPFLLDDDISASDWIAKLELATAAKMVETELLSLGEDRLKVLVLYGSLRSRYDVPFSQSSGFCKNSDSCSRSYSRLLAYEASRILFRLGCDVRVYDPSGLPVKDDVQHDHPKVQELRELSKWSDGHVWVTPEQHGNLVPLPVSHQVTKQRG